MIATRTRHAPPEPISHRASAIEQVRELTKRLRACGIKGDLATVIRAAVVLDYLGEWDRRFLKRITPYVQAGDTISPKQRQELRRIARDLDALQLRA